MQIVVIEDNCSIHRTLAVEKVIEKMKKSMIPIVLLSSSLNDVVEGYFGYMKMSSLPGIVTDNG